MAFVHLHVHSQFSLLDGTMTPEDLAKAAEAAGMPAIALTDTCNLYGAVAFYKACKSKGVKAIIGAELHVAPDGVDRKDLGAEGGGYQILALVEDDAGYQSLCALITAAIFDGMHYKPRVDLGRLREHAEGLIFLTGGRKGAFGRPLIGGDPAKGERWLRDLVGAVGAERLYLELQDHGLEGQAEVNDAARRLAAEHGLRCVVTNAVHYACPEDAVAHELLHSVAAGAALSDDGWPRAPTDQAWLKSEAEMRALFPDDPDALDATADIAARCDYHFKLAKLPTDYHFPATAPPDVAPDAPGGLDTDANWAYFYRAFPPPRSYGMPDPEVEIPPRPPGAGSIEGYFRWYAATGLDVRLRRIPEEKHPVYRDRLAFELDTVVAMQFPAYLLIVAEFINWSKDAGIPVGPGRGSAAGSIAAWAMGITDIDPIRFDLLFERFLNPERVSMPDIDVDFCQDRREEAIEHVRQKYGSPLVSQIITYGTFKAKAAVRDVCRALKIGFKDADRIAKLVPDDLNITLARALNESETLRRMAEGDPLVRRVISLASRIEGGCRQTGVHAAGVVIADKPLVHYAPLFRDGPEGGPVVQYDMKSAEGIGLIKFDFLGLKTLDQIRDATEMVARNHGVQIEMDALDIEDPATYALLQQGDAIGVFQLESSGMRELLTRLKPSCIDDLVALVALYRPGPLNSGMVDQFVNRKHGREAVSYALPMLEPILRPTYGTIVYQEQVMQIAQVMAGYSLGEADLLRRAMGKKKPEEMARERPKFVGGSVERGIDATTAEEVFDLLAMFAAYGFNKSHSAAYGLIAYQTAWLKAHYRGEYMAALMTIEAANTDKVLLYIQDCRRAGISVLPVCVNESERGFTVPKAAAAEGRSVIRFGLSGVKNVGSNSVTAILAAREAKGPFTDLLDFLDRVDARHLNKRVLEHLIKGGAFDFTGLPRAALCEGLDGALSAAQRRREDREAGQASLFGAAGAASPPPRFRFPERGEWPLMDKLNAEKAVVGMFLSGHPMQAHEAELKRFGCCAISALSDADPSGEVRVLAFPGEVRTVRTRRGDTMAFIPLEDAHGAVEAVFFSEPWIRSQAALKAGEPVLVVARVEHSAEATKLLATSAETLSDARQRVVKEVRLHLRPEDLSDDRLKRLLALFDTERGEVPVALRMTRPDLFAASFELPDRTVSPSLALESGLVELFGRTDVVELR